MLLSLYRSGIASHREKRSVHRLLISFSNLGLVRISYRIRTYLRFWEIRKILRLEIGFVPVLDRASASVSTNNRASRENK